MLLCVNKCYYFPIPLPVTLCSTPLKRLSVLNSLVLCTPRKKGMGLWALVLAMYWPLDYKGLINSNFADWGTSKLYSILVF